LTQITPTVCLWTITLGDYPSALTIDGAGLVSIPVLFHNVGTSQLKFIHFQEKNHWYDIIALQCLPVLMASLMVGCIDTDILYF